MTWTDEQVREAIVQSFEGERFTKSITELAYVPWWRSRAWLSGAAIATAAATVAGIVAFGGPWLGDREPVEPGAPTHSALPTRETSESVALNYAGVEQDCRAAGLSALRQADGIPADRRGQLPSKYGSSALLVGVPPSMMQEPRGPILQWIFADDHVLVHCVRYGRDGLDVSVTDVSDGKAPWLRANELPFRIGHDQTGRAYIAGWQPEDSYIYFSVVRDVALKVDYESDPVIPIAGAGLPYVAMLPPDAEGELTITALTKDQIIRRVGNQPASVSPR